MKALCVTPDRNLELRDIPTPADPPPGYLLVDIEAAAINHGDKTFLKNPQAAGNAAGFAQRLHDVWGASAAGRVIAVGSDVPSTYAGKAVAVYRSLQRDAPMVGLWCERALVPYRTSLPLPDSVSPSAYSGSLVNVITAYAFLEQVAAEGHAGVIVTAGNSATGHALAALARRSNTPAILLVRSAQSKADLQASGIEHVVVTQAGYREELGELSAKLGATAVFDGVGGQLMTDIAPVLPMRSCIYCYGVLAGAAPMSLSSLLFMMKDLSVRRFSNFESAMVRDPLRLEAALNDLAAYIEDPLFQTRVGQTFGLEQFEEAMRFETTPGSKAVFTP